MKFRKSLSKGLVLGLFFSNSNYFSYAGTLDDSGRYETFEDDNITIDRVLSPDSIDAEIEGNTAVNIVRDSLSIDVQAGSLVDLDLIYEIAPNKEYTVMFTTDKPRVYGGFVNENRNGWIDGGRFDESKCVAGFNQFLITPTVKSSVFRFRHDNNDAQISNVILLEGNWIGKEFKEYFEGMQSVGEIENNELDINIANKNWLPYNNVTVNAKPEVTWYDVNGIRGIYGGTAVEGKTNTWFNLKAGYYKIKADDFNCGYQVINTKEEVFYLDGNTYVPEGKYCIRLKNNNTTDEFGLRNASIVEYNKPISAEHVDREVIQKKIILNEPLRGVPGGVKDRIIKKNGQWFIERNCYEYKIDDVSGSNWVVSTTNSGKYLDGNLNDVLHKVDAKCISNNLPSSLIASSISPNFNSICASLQGKSQWRIKIIGLDTKEQYVEWVRNNPINVVVERDAPIYEPLKLDLSIDLFEDITYISTNTNVPANIKFTIDRVLNRAIEAVEAAKLNPTRATLAQARLWTNLAKDSIKKDSLQSELDSIKQVDDLTLEKKKVTSNIDVYIKSDNALSMSLNTSQVTFDNYSGIEEIEKLKALNIKVSSSLPYDLNAYMPTPISNVDGTDTMDMGLFNIKESSDSNYKKFTNNTDKVALKTECQAGNNNLHDIDLKLDMNRSHKPDVYKTVIKFEVQQR